MLRASIKKPSLLHLLTAIQISALLIYLSANISNVGRGGMLLPLLIFYFVTSNLILFFLSLKKKLFVKLSLLIFLLLMVWVALRIVFDLGDVAYLKEIIAGTTGGILLFYLLGAFLSLAYYLILMPTSRMFVIKYALLLFIILLFFISYELLQRLRTDLFYLEGVEGAYQRPGNFLSIAFIIFSFTYFLLVLKGILSKVSTMGFLFWSAIYTLSILITLLISQVMGSNSATVVTFGVYFITLIATLTIARKRIFKEYLNQKLALPWSKQLFRYFGVLTLIILLLLMVIFASIIFFTDFDILSLRFFGFGEGVNTSLVSRLEILSKTGLVQLTFSPLLGNINVAYLTTGTSAGFLHSFFPYVIANLGLLGLAITLALIINIFSKLYREIKSMTGCGFVSYQVNMVALYSFLILLFILIVANLATSISWPVFWFTLGFVSRPIFFR